MGNFLYNLLANWYTGLLSLSEEYSSLFDFIKSAEDFNQVLTSKLIKLVFFKIYNKGMNEKAKAALG